MGGRGYVWPIRASEAPVQAQPAAFRGWNPTPDANHLLKAIAGGKLSIFSQRSTCLGCGLTDYDLNICSDLLYLILNMSILNLDMFVWSFDMFC